MDDSREYFAYGCNVNLDEMADRCPNARVVGTATLENYALVFRGSSYTSGCGSIEPREGSVVHGVLWKITPKCERTLNAFEGYPWYYDQQRVAVRDVEGKSHTAMVYVMTKQRALVPGAPTRAYIDCIRDGYRQNGIDVQHLEDALRSFEEELAAMRESCRKPVQKQAKNRSHHER